MRMNKKSVATIVVALCLATVFVSALKVIDDDVQLNGYLNVDGPVSADNLTAWQGLVSHGDLYVEGETWIFGDLFAESVETDNVDANNVTTNGVSASTGRVGYLDVDYVRATDIYTYDLSVGLGNRLEACSWQGPYSFDEDAVCTHDKFLSGMRISARPVNSSIGLEIRCCWI